MIHYKYMKKIGQVSFLTQMSQWNYLYIWLKEILWTSIAFSQDYVFIKIFIHIIDFQMNFFKSLW
jgi:hypothetical protein